MGPEQAPGAIGNASVHRFADDLGDEQARLRPHPIGQCDPGLGGLLQGLRVGERAGGDAQVDQWRRGYAARALGGVQGAQGDHLRSRPPRRGKRLRCTRSTQAGTQMRRQRGVRAVHETAFHPARHQRPVSVPDDPVAQFAGSLRIGAQPLPQPAHGLVGPCPPCDVGNDLPVPEDQVRADDHAHVVQFQPLAGVDAAPRSPGPARRGAPKPVRPSRCAATTTIASVRRSPPWRAPARPRR